MDDDWSELKNLLLLAAEANDASPPFVAAMLNAYDHFDDDDSVRIEWANRLRPFAVGDGRTETQGEHNVPSHD